MDTSKIIKKITDGHIRLPNTTRLKVSDMLDFLVYAKVPYYKVSRPEKGYLWSERPLSLRFIVNNAVDEHIREDFLDGRLELLDFRSKHPIPVDKASRFNNPFDLSITFDEFVRYAKLGGVTVTVEDDAYFDCLPNEVFLKALDIAGLVLADGGTITTPTDEAVLNEAHSWINECFMGTVICESNEVDINNYASEQDAVLDIYVIELNSAIELAEILKKPTEHLKERLIQISLSAPQRVDNSLETRAEALPDAGADNKGGNEPASTTKPRKKRQPVERGEKNEGLLFVDELLTHYGIEYLDELPAIKAWGKITSGDFSSNSFKQVSDAKKSITLASGEKLDKSDFSEKYRKRFKPE